ncbi:MAG: CHAT domain-containing protein, partial [Alphaproteobacteria bacterium]|nr:CHAT domain-containing protein [Alphaproteobacteria bacterium]
MERGWQNANRSSAIGAGGVLRGLTLGGLLAVAPAASGAEESPATAPRVIETPGPVGPSRTIDDITAILDAQKLDDPAEMKRTRRAASRKRPEKADDATLARFYFERGIAASSVGKVSQAIADLGEALMRRAHLSARRQVRLLRTLSRAELEAGDHAKGIAHLRAGVVLSDALERPLRSKVDFLGRLASVLAARGEMGEAERHLARAKNVIRRMESFTGRMGGRVHLHPAHLSSTALGVLHGSEGRVLMAAGRYVAAEAALRRALEAHVEGQDENREHTARSGLARILSAQGRQLEAEVEMRRALLYLLRRSGRSHPRTAHRVVGLAGIIEAQGRLEEGARLYRAALDILKAIGADPASAVFLRARRGLAINLARRGHFGPALRQFEAAARANPGAASRSRDTSHALILIRTGNAREGLGVARRAARRSARLRGEDHVSTLAAKGTAATALLAMGREAESLARLKPLVGKILPRLRPSDGSGGAVRQWQMRLVLEGYMAQLMSREGAAGGEPAFPIADGLRDRKVQRAFGYAAARVAAKRPELGKLINRQKQLAEHHAALKALYADVLSRPMAADRWKSERDWQLNSDPDYPVGNTPAGLRFLAKLKPWDEATRAEALDDKIEKLAAERGLTLGFAEQEWERQGRQEPEYPLIQGYPFPRWQSKYPSGIPGQSVNAPSDRLSNEITAVRSARARVATQIARRFPGYAALIHPPPPTMAEARASLRPHEALIATYVAEEATYVWALGKQGPHAFAAVPIGRVRLAQMVERLRKGLTFRGDSLVDIPVFDVDLAHQLYDRLLAPVAGAWRGARTLLIVPHGPLAQLPFSLLVTEKAQVRDGNRPLFAGYRDVPWLVRRHAIATLPSVATLRALRRYPQARSKDLKFVGFADPIFNKTQLAEAASAERVGSRGRDAAPPLLLRSAPDRRRRTLSSLSDLQRLPETAREVRGIAGALGVEPGKFI